MTTELLSETARAAEAALDPAPVAGFRERLDGPLAIVASGGALPAAALWAFLHLQAGHPAWTMTPYALAEQGVPPGTRVLLLSSGGGHHDVLRAARHASAAGWPLSAVTCTASGPLATLVREAAGADAVLALPAAPHADRLLPVHALVPILIAAAHVSGGPGPFAERFAVLPAEVPARRPRFVVALGVGAAAPAAIDFAGRAQESGIAPAWHGDVRNFSHGQFLTLAAAPEEALLVAFTARAQRDYLDRWAARLPAGVGLIRVATDDDGAGAALSLLARSIRTFEALAAAVEYDVGMERIPSWGRGLYLLEA